MEEKIKQLRVTLDGTAKLIANLVPSGEVALARTSCETSKMWLGKVLQGLGVVNPYPDSKDPSNEKIEPTADVFVLDSASEYIEYSHIQKVKYIRKQLESIDGDIFDSWLNNDDNIASIKILISLEYAFKHCVESGMWLGAELGRINSEASK